MRFDKQPKHCRRHEGGYILNKGCKYCFDYHLLLHNSPIKPEERLLRAIFSEQKTGDRFYPKKS